MAFVEDVISMSARIERKFCMLLGQELSLNEAIEASKSKFSKKFITELHALRMIRNSIAHETNYYSVENQSDILIRFNKALSKLESTQSNEYRDSNYEMKLSSGTNVTMTNKILDENEWVRLEQVSLGDDYQSSEYARLAFLSKNSISVKEVGNNHSAGYGFGFGWLNDEQWEQVAFVKMTPGVIGIYSHGEVYSADKVPLELRIEVSVRVKNSDDAISKCIKNLDYEIKYIGSKVLAIAKDYFSEFKFDEVNRRQADFKNVLHKDARVLSAFLIEELVSLKVSSISSIINDRGVTEYIDGASAERELRRIQAEIIKLNRQHDVQAELLRLDKSKFEAKMSKMKSKAELYGSPGGLWAIDPAAAKEIEIEKIRLNAMIAKSQAEAAALEREREHRVRELEMKLVAINSALNRNNFGL